MEESKSDADRDVRCPKCGSNATVKRFFGAKRNLISLVSILFGAFWFVMAFQMLSKSQGEVTLGVCFLFVFGLAATVYGISGFVGKRKCSNCGLLYR